MLTDRSRIARPFARKAFCSSLAIATALIVGSGMAQAQSLQGNGTFASGTGTIGTATGTTTVNITSSDAVIDWTTFDTAIGGGPINFQPTSTTATFQSVSDFSVLNRIIPTDPSRAVQFNGNVVAQIQGGSPVPGGTVYFYSPGGVIVGSTAVFNVGNLGLTSAAPQVVGGAFEQGTPPNEFVNFTAANPGTAVRIQPGAQINVLDSSYLAIVAPVIEQRGIISVDGVAALVSADAATITFNQNGLFDIQVTSGTSGTGTTLFNDGSITGPAFSGIGPSHRIYAVAVPKNTAITLAIGQGSQLGFNIAGAADVVGNAVVLSAGKDIVAGNIATGRSAGGGTGAADLNIANTAVTSSLRGASTDETFFFSIGGGTASTASTVNLQADTRATYTADGAGSVTTGNGMVTLDSQRSGNGVTGGRTDIFAVNNGSLSITSGGATLNSRGFGFNGATPGSVGGNATGGIALIQALSGGDVSITGPVNIQAGGFGGSGNAAAGGTGTGGLSQIFARDTGSSVTINGLANVGADGIGGVGNGGSAGGLGTGGQAFINAQVAASDGISITGAAGIGANGIGGNANSGPAGAGFGGLASAAASVNNNLQFGSNLNVVANGTGGNVSGSGAAGSGTGGTARINLFSTGTVSVTGAAQVQSIGFAGIGNPNSAVGTGNIAAVTVQQNSSLNVTGMLQVSASGLGDRTLFGLPTNGAGSGGTATVDAFTNGAITVGGVLRTRADATSANGGNSTGGTAIVAANSGGDITASELGISTDGVGGADTGTGAGSGSGGTSSLFASGAGSTVTIANGNSTGMVNLGELDFISAEGFGGQNNGGGSGVGGAATGGTTSINVNNGAVLTGPANVGTQSFVRVIARATGGNANTGATAGGNATGGAINITIDNATMTSANMLPSSFAMGGSFTTGATGNIAGGNAIGGSRNITVNNGGSLTTQFIGGGPGAQGGNGLGTGNGGSGTGGSANLTVDNGSTLSLTGSSGVFSQNSGGVGGSAGMGGNGIAGNAFVRVANGSTLTMAGPTTNSFFVGATAFGSFSPTVSLTGGNSTAGTATFVIDNATANLQLVTISANGDGAGGLVAQGGNGTGGTATLQLINGTLNADTVDVFAVGSGGSIDLGQVGTAGNGTGGLARIIATGGTSTITSAQFVDIGADGLGGNMSGTGPATGSGTGGRAALVVSGGAALTVNTQEVSLASDGEGGEELGGSANVGGFGTAGQTDVFANGGTLTINGDLGLEADNDGGEGAIGGNGVRRTDGIPNALIRAQNGTITVTGLTELISQGDGSGGSLGGAGGNAEGGFVVIDALSSLAGPSLISLQNLVLDSTAIGGSGGLGIPGGGAGGAGGNAFGGPNQLFGNAGNGVLTIAGSTTLDASGTGGDGGMGGAGVNGGAGGAAGTGTGGFIQFGTKSGLATGTINTGSATFQGVLALSNGNGGTGGNGHVGSTTTGLGGRGGDAFDGGITVLVRGSPVTINGTAGLVADAIGGNGGSGSTAGVGGNATVGSDPVAFNPGGLGVAVTNRFEFPDQPGTLTAGIITGNAFAIVGNGSARGASFVADSPLGLEITNSTATISSLELNAVAGTPLPATGPSFLRMTNATASISNLFLNTLGTLSVSLDNSTLNTDTLTLSAFNFVLPTVVPTAYGTISVTDSLDIGTTTDLVAYANFDLGFDAAFAVPGTILVGDVTVAGTLQASAGTTLTAGNISATNVELQGVAGLTSNAITSTGSIELDSTGAITTGQLTASDTVEANAGGVLTVAGASAGLVNPSTDPLAEYNVGLRSLTSVAVGDVAARANFGVSSPGSIAVGNVSVGQVFLALPGTSLTTGSISTALQSGSRVYIGNFSMEALGGQVASNFDPAPILALAPVATGGPIAINGPVSTIIIQAATLQSIAATGTIQTPGVTVLVAGTTLNAADIVVGDRAIIAAGGNITLGNVNAGITLPSNGLRKIAIGSTSGNVTTGNLAATFDLGIQAGGGISTGSLSGRQILLLAGTNVSTAAISAVVGTQQVGQLYVGNFSMATPTANVFQPFQSPTAGPLPIFGLTPVRTGGSITFGGSVQVGNVDAAAGTSFTASAITASNDIDIEAGGLASVNGAWSSTDIDLISGDIAIASSGSLTASATGEILLASTNSAGMFVGDGLTGTTSPTGDSAGYRLSNDEFSRVRAGEIAIVGNDIANLATDLTIGTLTINASQLLGADGLVLFASGNRETETPSGILRIAGAVTGNGFSPTNSIELLSGTVEIEATNGSLKVNAGGSDSGSGSGTSSLGGLIYVEADHIHIASDAILTKLRADPFYTGYIDELNAPAAVQRPDGVFNALGFEIDVGETFYIQNTGSRIVPAGFLTTFDNTEVFATGERTGGVEIVINGQFQTSTGTVTGKAAFDQVIADPEADDEQFFGFSESSQLNGCVFLSGVCAFGGGSIQMAPPASEISVIISPVLATSPPPPAVEEAGPGDSSASSSDSEAAAEEADSSEDEKKDEGEGDEAASPIAPPTPLISTRALDSDVNVVEPVSGAGNPALFGSAVDETTVQGEKP